MALIKCPHCGQPVSDSATQCPHCQKKLVTAGRIKKCSSAAMLLSFIIPVAWLIWFLGGERQRNTAVKVGIIICFLSIISPIIINIAFPTSGMLYGIVLVCALLIAFGVTLFFLKKQGKIKILTKAVGILYVIYYFTYFILSWISKGGTVFPDTSMFLILIIIVILTWIGSIITTAVLFYRINKQAKLELSGK